MNDREKKEKLVSFLDEKAFDPILRKSSGDFDGKNREMFEDVRQSTESEKKRFHDNYRTAREVRENYMSDLTSDTGKRISRELDELGLPSLPAIKRDFLRLCDDLQV